MNEDEVNIEKQEEDVWQPPPLPEEIVAEEIAEPEMSELATLGNIFIEPGRTFEDLRRKPRFILAGILILIFVVAFQALLFQHVGFKEIKTAQLEKSPQVQQLEPDKKKELIEQQSSPIVKYVTLGIFPIVVLITFALGGLIYWLGSMAMGGTSSYLQGLSVWVYSSFPPAIISGIVNIIVLFLKPVENIDLATSQQGVLQANPTFFMNVVETPVLAALLSSFDLFFIWGYILAIIGLKRVAKISTFSSAAIVLFLALLFMAAKVIAALIFG